MRALWGSMNNHSALQSSVKVLLSVVLSSGMFLVLESDGAGRASLRLSRDGSERVEVWPLEKAWTRVYRLANVDDSVEGALKLAAIVAAQNNSSLDVTFS